MAFVAQRFLVFLSLFTVWCPASVAQGSFSETLAKKSLLYFQEQSHAQTGLVLDRADNFGPIDKSSFQPVASIAATGFGMAVFANAAQRGLMNPAEAEARILRTLIFTRTHLYHKNGWLYHFVNWQTGERVWQCEISTIDTAWFLAGAMYAAAVFPHTEIATETARFLDRLDFNDMLTDGGLKPTKHSLSQGWRPETGYIPFQWDAYAEQMLMLIVGLGKSHHALPDEAWTKWIRNTALIKSRGVMGADLPLFVHQYSHAFIDFADLKEQNTQYVTNSQLATKINRSVATHHSEFKTFKLGFWGLSASDAVTGYAAFSPLFFDGTVCLGCAGASVMFNHDILKELAAWSVGPYHERFFGRYGFSDGINIDQNWFDHQVIGITIGTLYLALANISPSTEIWHTFNRIPEIERGLKRASALGKVALLGPEQRQLNSLSH